jgi:hypothetical protein
MTLSDVVIEIKQTITNTHKSKVYEESIVMGIFKTKLGHVSDPKMARQLRQNS